MNYILGSGLSGIIAGYLLQCPVIGETLGGQFSSSLPQGPKYFHDCDGMKQLLYDLKIKYTIKTRKVGYYDWTKKSFVKQTPEFIKQYYFRTRGYPKPEEQLSVMNDSKDKFNTLEFDYQKFIVKLASSISITKDSVVSIDLSQSLIRTASGKELEFDNLISTLNAKIFYNLIYAIPSQETFDAWSKLFLYTDPNLKKYGYGSTRFKKYDMVYCVGSRETPSRVTNLDDGVQIIEFTGTASDMQRLSEKILATKKLLVHDIEIRKDLDLDYRSRVANGRLRTMYFLGRSAEWKHSRRIDQGMFARINYIKERIANARLAA